jgi:uncharacterized coiled-coil protein SlyX
VVLNLLTSLASIIIPIIGATAWLVRLEGKVATADNRIKTLEDQAKASEETKIEVVRLQEQIKNLTNLLERYLLDSRSDMQHGR